MPEMPSKPEPSERLKANGYMMRCLALGMPLQECERRAEGAERLKAAFIGTPFYAERAARDPDYWSKLYDSSVNW